MVGSGDRRMDLVSRVLSSLPKSLRENDAANTFPPWEAKAM